MPTEIDAERLVQACSDEGFDAGIKIFTELDPLSGPGSPVKPPVYEGGHYQQDKRWESVDAEHSTDVIVLDNVPSQANRLEAAAMRAGREVGLPEITLDLSAVGALPAHLPRKLSSWQFPHRNADAYLRDAELDGVDFLKSDVGRAIFESTSWSAAPLMAWLPQGLLFGFWQSHLGKKRSNAKHARAWVSEIIGWKPAATGTRVMGVKGDAMNLGSDVLITKNKNDQAEWVVHGQGKVEDGERDRLSEIGHGQVPFMKEGDAAPAAISFARISQTSTVSFAQLRRVSLGQGFSPDSDAVARALLVAMGLYLHVHAFSRAFELRSVADLRPQGCTTTWLGASSDEEVGLPSADEARELVRSLTDRGRAASVPLDGWGAEPLLLTPKQNLIDAIKATWPLD